MMRYQGLDVIPSFRAVSKPKRVPHTDDMRAMVDHFDRLGLIREIPMVFQLGSNLIIHPVLLDALKARADAAGRFMVAK